MTRIGLGMLNGVTMIAGASSCFLGFGISSWNTDILPGQLKFGCSLPGFAGDHIIWNEKLSLYGNGLGLKVATPGYPAADNYNVYFPGGVDMSNLFIDTQATAAVPGLTSLGTVINPNQVGLTTLTGNQNQDTVQAVFDAGGNFYFQNSRSPNPWAVGTTYAMSALVTAGDLNIYSSLINGNIGNDPTVGPSDWTLIGPSRLSNVQAKNFIFNILGGNFGIGMTPTVPLDVAGEARATSLVASKDDTNVFPGAILAQGKNNPNQNFYMGYNTFPTGAGITVVNPSNPVIFASGETPNTGQSITISGFTGACAFLNGTFSPTVVVAGQFFSIPVNGAACTPSQNTASWADNTSTPGDYAVLQCVVQGVKPCTVEINPASGNVNIGAYASVSQAGTITGINGVYTAAAPTVSAAQVGFGGTIAVTTNCGSLASSVACLVVNVAGTTHYIPYY